MKSLNKLLPWVESLLIIAIVLTIFTQSGNVKAEEIGSVETTGWFAKDTLRVEVFDDPNITGVSCYLTRYDRWNPLAEDSSATSIACRQTGIISGKLTNSSDVFSANLNPYFKAKKVRRFWDSKRRVLVYLAYTRKFSGKNKSHSISVVVVPNTVAGDSNETNSK